MKIEVHPRERGEHGEHRHQGGAGVGSSPRARGTLEYHANRRKQMRFIPASAGNTRSGCRCCGRPAVHPRERGEHADGAVYMLSQAGSSPRARGTRLRGAFQPPVGRFIPASAGNTARKDAEVYAIAVHPRERGEHARRDCGGVCHVGSSPRARGTRAAGDVRAVRLRFIPASAGNTSRKTAPARSPAVHPRERGEHVKDAQKKEHPCGSSPRARGTRISARAPAMR